MRRVESVGRVVEHDDCVDVQAMVGRRRQSSADVASASSPGPTLCEQEATKRNAPGATRAGASVDVYSRTWYGVPSGAATGVAGTAGGGAPPLNAAHSA